MAVPWKYYVRSVAGQEVLHEPSSPRTLRSLR